MIHIIKIYFIFDILHNAVLFFSVKAIDIYFAATRVKL